MNDIIIISIFALFIIYVASIYNRVIRKKNNTEKAFGTVEILLKKRYDLLPNLVAITKQYAVFEASVLTEINRIQNELSNSSIVDEKISLHNYLNKQVNTLLLKTPNHPELKTSQHFLRLQAAWNETEEQISAARRYYNAAVSEYNNAIQTFPANILMNKTTYPEKTYLEFDNSINENIQASRIFKES